MSQISLFQSEARTLVSDEKGDISYVPNVISETESLQWFQFLLDTAPWHGERRRMYDRDIDTPRLLCSYRLDDPELPDIIHAASNVVRAQIEAPFTRVGLNLYRNGNDSVAPHSDHFDELVVDHPIVILSLGSSRRMTIQSKKPPRRSMHIDLEMGSLFIMSYASQLHYLHGIPKTPGHTKPRISLAFRVCRSPNT